jgi:hypothetical protein
LRYLASARQQGIWLRDGHALEMLQRVDVLIVTAALAEGEQPRLQPDPTLTIVVIATDTTDLAKLIAEQQAAGHVVAYLGGESTPLPLDARPDLWISTSAATASGAAIRLPADQPAPLEALLALRAALTASRKRGLYLALAPSVINLSGIYFLRFGVITTLLVDYGGTAAGMLNALGPRLRLPKSLTSTTEKGASLSVV